MFRVLLCVVQRLFKRVSQALLAAQLRVAVCALRPSIPAQETRLSEPDWTSRLLASRRHDYVAALLAYLFVHVFVCLRRFFWKLINFALDIHLFNSFINLCLHRQCTVVIGALLLSMVICRYFLCRAEVTWPTVVRFHQSPEENPA